MANIRDPDTPDLSIRPSNMGTDAVAAAARRGGAFFNEASQSIAGTGRRIASAIEDAGNVAVKYMDHREISHGAAEFATGLSNLDTAWNQTVSKADPNDPSVAAKFREETLEPTLEKLRDGFNTERSQAYAEGQINRLRDHFTTKTSADMARLAGVAVKSNLETLTNQLTNAAMSDPTSLKVSLDMIEHSVGDMVDSSPNLKGVDGATLKMSLLKDAQTSIVKAAAIGAISANPDAGLAQFSKPEYSKYISGAELKQLEQQAKTVQRASRADATNQRVLADKQKEDASDQREGEYFARLHSDDPKVAGSVTAKAIANDFTLTRSARERMVTIAEKATEPDPPARVSSATTVDILNRIRLPSDDPRRIADLGPVYDEFAKGKLTKADFKFVRDEIASVRTPEGAALGTDRTMFFKQYAGAIANMTPDPDGKVQMYDPIMGSPKLYAAEMDARRKEQNLRQKGLDPHLLYDPSSEYFLGKPSTLSKYRGSLQSDLETKATTPASAPARKDAMPAIPPADQRPPGLYETPKGKLQWTGTGWVKP